MGNWFFFCAPRRDCGVCYCSRCSWMLMDGKEARGGSHHEFQCGLFSLSHQTLWTGEAASRWYKHSDRKKTEADWWQNGNVWFQETETTNTLGKQVFSKAMNKIAPWQKNNSLLFWTFRTAIYGSKQVVHLVLEGKGQNRWDHLRDSRHCHFVQAVMTCYLCCSFWGRICLKNHKKWHTIGPEVALTTANLMLPNRTATTTTLT